MHIQSTSAVLLKISECTSLYSNRKLAPEWELIIVNFGPTQKIGSKVGGWQSLKGGHTLLRLQYTFTKRMFLL